MSDAPRVEAQIACAATERFGFRTCAQMPSDQLQPDYQRPATAAECGHKCKDKGSCGHACCKRHLAPELQLKAAQQPSHQSSLGLPECGHKCRNKIACGHRCCKRHLSQQELARGRQEGSSVILQVVPQAARKSQHDTCNSNLQQVRRASSGPQLGVQGKSIAQAKSDPEARSSDATPSFHFFIYDIESTGKMSAHCKTAYLR